MARNTRIIKLRLSLEPYYGDVYILVHPSMETILRSKVFSRIGKKTKEWFKFIDGERGIKQNSASAESPEQEKIRKLEDRLYQILPYNVDEHTLPDWVRDELVKVLAEGLLPITSQLSSENDNT